MLTDFSGPSFCLSGALLSANNKKDGCNSQDNIWEKTGKSPEVDKKKVVSGETILLMMS